LRKGESDRGHNNAFKKETAPAGVAVVSAKQGFLPGSILRPTRSGRAVVLGIEGRQRKERILDLLLKKKGVHDHHRPDRGRRPPSAAAWPHVLPAEGSHQPLAAPCGSTHGQLGPRSRAHAPPSFLQHSPGNAAAPP
jgi:hypothetical protein